jgi:hypothetical protein
MAGTAMDRGAAGMGRTAADKVAGTVLIRVVRLLRLPGRQVRQGLQRLPQATWSNTIFSTTEVSGREQMRLQSIPVAARGDPLAAVFCAHRQNGGIPRLAKCY